MSITVRVTGVFLGDPLNQTLEEPFREGDTPKKILARLDKKKALGRKFFRGTLESSRATFLLNGDRLEIPSALNEPLSDGDEISVLSAIAGGRSPSNSQQVNLYGSPN
jgi:molybdopterin converting factor small subunit